MARPRCRAWVFALCLSIFAATCPAGQAEAREERVVAIGEREMRIALGGGDCFFDADQPAGRELLDQLTATSGGRFVVLLAFSGCEAIDGWRRDHRRALPRFGYVMIAETHLEPVFDFDQQTLSDAISQALKQHGVTDYRSDMARLARDLEAAWTTLGPGGRMELGIVHRDRYGPVQATVLAVPSGDGLGIVPRVMLHQSLMASGKVISVVAVRDYETVETVFDTYGDLSKAVEATASRN
ncbi:MAG TPA: hypothetical protein VIR38_09765 [Thalassobaculum sp.]